MVLIHRPTKGLNQAKKLMHSFSGPRRVMCQTSENNYKIYTGGPPDGTEIVHAGRIRKYEAYNPGEPGLPEEVFPSKSGCFVDVMNLCGEYPIF